MPFAGSLWHKSRFSSTTDYLAAIVEGAVPDRYQVLAGTPGKAGAVLGVQQGGDQGLPAVAEDAELVPALPPLHQGRVGPVPAVQSHPRPSTPAGRVVDVPENISALESFQMRKYFSYWV